MMKNNLNLHSALEYVGKKSTQIVQQVTNQISEKIPQKFLEKILPIGFSIKNRGVKTKLSIFRNIQMSSENIVKSNEIVGCQWFIVDISDKCEVKNNKFIAIHLSQFSLFRSDLCDSLFSLSHMRHITLQEACFTKNKISLSAWSEINVTESDFTSNALTRCYFSGVVINSSRLSRLNFTHVSLKDCEFDSCDIQGFEFHDCEFKDCCFTGIVAVSSTVIKISGCRFVGKKFTDCKSVEEFVALLKRPRD